MDNNHLEFGQVPVHYLEEAMKPIRNALNAWERGDNPEEYDMAMAVLSRCEQALRRSRERGWCRPRTIDGVHRFHELVVREDPE